MKALERREGSEDLRDPDPREKESIGGEPSTRQCLSPKVLADQRGSGYKAEKLGKVPSHLSVLREQKLEFRNGPQWTPQTSPGTIKGLPSSRRGLPDMASSVKTEAQLPGGSVSEWVKGLCLTPWFSQCGLHISSIT